LLDDLISILMEKCYYSLVEVADANSTTAWRQEWNSAKMIGLRGEEVEQWEGYLTNLRTSHAWKKHEEDELVWSRNDLVGVYTSKLGYKVLSEGEFVEDLVWWWKKLWKYKSL
jgi:hypothetical protein